MLTLHHILALLSGSTTGFVLGLIGGGGSVLAVPLLIYLVGVSDPHVAIGTSAFAVAVNAFANLIPHARAGHVKWATASLFAAVGIIGAALGSTLGKSIDGHSLLALFAVFMLVVAVLMARGRHPTSEHAKTLTRRGAAKTAGAGLAVGGLSGLFGIGGGFLVVPGLVFATGMPIIEAIGSSLVAVTAFGLTTAINYAFAGYVAWTIALYYLAGGIVGGWAGAKLATHLSRNRMTLNRIFGAVLAAVGIYMLVRSLAAIG